MCRSIHWFSMCAASCLVVQAVPAMASPGDAPSDKNTVTYAKQISRIFQSRCQDCHRPGQIGPFSLLDFESAKNWSDTIKEVVNERRMPPWFADRSAHKFSNDRSLSDEELATINRWIDAGCPKGDDADLPQPRRFTDGWFIGQPDAVFTMNEQYEVPATGTIPYKYFVIPTNFTEDKWIQSIELKAGAPSVVHHILMSVRPPEAQAIQRFRDSRDSDEASLGFFAALAPGYVPPGFPSGFGKKIPKGANIVFQMHYTPNGTPATDRSSVGLVFAREPVHTEVRTRGIFNNFFTIPANDDNYKVTSGFRFPQDSVVLSFMPHMHLRGKDFEYTAEYPDGRTEKVLNVPHWNFNWQVHYELEKPLTMPKGSKISCVAHFDNSAANKANPDPNKRVGWGDQTWDEMMIGYINYYVPHSETTSGAGR
jgi:mono/diheme cytochrome c family protein